MSRLRVLTDCEIKGDDGNVLMRVERAFVYERDDGWRAIAPIPDDVGEELDGHVLEHLGRAVNDAPPLTAA